VTRIPLDVVDFWVSFDRAIAIVVAAGRSRRMAVAAQGEASEVRARPLAGGSPERAQGVTEPRPNKLLMEALGRPVLAWTLSVFEASPLIERVYLTAMAEDVEPYRTLARREGFSKVSDVVVGGEERQQSVFLALQHVERVDAAAHLNPLVAVHDGARPLLSQSLLERVVREAAVLGGAIPAVPAKETLKLVADDGSVLETIPRDRVMVAQTPQVFHLDDLLDAHRQAYDSGLAVTDDAALIERLGGVARVVPGAYDNIKVTTPEDLVVLEALLRRLSLTHVTRGAESGRGDVRGVSERRGGGP